jgi:hypothetical protein
MTFRSEVSMSEPRKQVLMTSAQASEYLKIPVSTLVDWRYKRMGPPFIRISARHVRYDLELLTEWLQKKMIESIPEAVNQ